MSLTKRYQQRTESIDETTGIRTIHTGTDWRGFAHMLMTCALIGVLTLTAMWIGGAWLLSQLGIAAGRELPVSAICMVSLAVIGGGVVLLLAAFKQASISASAGQQKTIETMADTMNRSMDIMQAQQQGFQSAMTSLMQARMQTQGQPLQIQPPVTQNAPVPTQTLQSVDNSTMRLMPTQATDPVIQVPMQNGSEKSIKLKHIEAIYKMRPQVSQDRWLANGGGAVSDYGPICEALCEAEPPLLLRKPKGKGYELAVTEQGAAEWWQEIVCSP